MFLIKMQRMICNVIGVDLVSRLQLHCHCCKVPSLCMPYNYVHDNLFSLIPSIYEFNRTTRLTRRLRHLKVEMAILC